MLITNSTYKCISNRVYELQQGEKYIDCVRDFPLKYSTYPTAPFNLTVELVEF